MLDHCGTLCLEEHSKSKLVYTASVCEINQIKIRSLLELAFYDIDDTEVFTLNSKLLHECDLNGTFLSYQPYRYAAYNVCDAMHDVDPVNNHYQTFH